MKLSFPICVLQAVAFLDLLAIGMIIPLIPNHVRQMGGDHIDVGLLGSIYSGFQLFSGPLIGSLSDLKGRKSILMMTLLLCAVCYIITGLTSSIIVILVIRAVLGLFKQTQLLSKALVPDYECDETKQSEIFGKMAAISGAGITLGPVIGGHLVEDHPEHGLTIIGIIVGLCFILNAGVVHLLPNTQKNPVKKKSKVPSTFLQNMSMSTKQTFSELYTVEWSEYWEIFMFKALIGFAMGVYNSNYSLYLKTQYDLTPKYVGYVVSFQGIIGSVSSYFMGYINRFYEHDNDFSQRNFHVFLITSFSFIGFILSFNVYVYLLCLIPLAVGNAMGRLVTLEMILRRCHGQHRGTLIGASCSVRSLTGVFAPMTAGLIGQYAGLQYVVYACICSTVIGSIVSYKDRTKNLRLKDKND